MMSYGAADQTLMDIDEFERRLREPSPRPAGDPLANLARLVTPANTKPEALDQMFARSPKAEIAPALSVKAYDHAQSDDFTSAELRGAVHGEEVFPHDRYADPPVSGERIYNEAAIAAPEESWSGAEQMVPPTTAARSRRPLYATAAVIAAGLLGIGSTFAFKSPRTGNGSELVEIKAPTGPTKIQGADAGRTTGDATILEKGSASTPVTKIVDRQERPVELKDAVTKQPRVVSVTPSGSTQMASLAAAAASGGDTNPATLAEPRKVKTVSVRPDGSIVNAPIAVPADPTPAGIPTSVSAPGSAKSATPKVAARVATTPKPNADKPDAIAKPATPKVEAAKPAVAKSAVAKPTRVARVADEDADGDTDATPVATTSRSTGGGFSVQLAAPGSETEAKSMASRLGQKFSDALGGVRVSVQKASDKDIYRVRTASMSREQAVSACEKVKAAGGSCFVAKN